MENKNSFKPIYNTSQNINPFYHEKPVSVWIPVIISCTKTVLQSDIYSAIPFSLDKLIRCNRKLFIDNGSLYNLDNQHGRVFLSGFLKEDFEFMEVDHESSSNKVRFYSVEIPFDCIGEVEYYIEPILNKKDNIPLNINGVNKPPVNNSLKLEIIDSTIEEIAFKSLNKEYIHEILLITLSFVLTQKRLINVGSWFT